MCMYRWDLGIFGRVQGGLGCVDGSGLRSLLMMTIHIISNRGSQIPELLLSFTSICHLSAQISVGLGPFFPIELLKTGRKEQAV